MRAHLRSTTSKPVRVGPPRCCQAAYHLFCRLVAIESAQSVGLEFYTESFNMRSLREDVRNSHAMNPRMYRFVHNDRRDASESLLPYEFDIKSTSIRVCGENLSATSNHEDPREVALRESISPREFRRGEIERR